MKKIVKIIIAVVIVLCAIIASINFVARKNDQINAAARQRIYARITITEDEAKQLDEEWKTSPSYRRYKENPLYATLPDGRKELSLTKRWAIEEEEFSKVRGDIFRNREIITGLVHLRDVLFACLLYLILNLLCLAANGKKWMQPIIRTLRPFSAVIICALTLVLYHTIVTSIADPRSNDTLIKGIYDLFHNSKMAMILLCVSHIIKFPMAICMFIALILGIIFVGTWYAPTIQYMVLEISAYFLAKPVIGLLGPTVSDGGLYGKIKNYFHGKDLYLKEDKIIIKQDADTADSDGETEDDGCQQAPMTIDDLPKLRSLLDEGIITQEEFDEVKKRILGQ